MEKHMQNRVNLRLKILDYLI